MHIPASTLRALKRAVGQQNVCTDDVSVLLHAYDCSLSRMRPDVVIHLTKAEQVARVVKILHRHHIPFVARAGATNHAGSCSTPKGGAVLNLAALTNILQINTQAGYALVEPGVVTAQLGRELKPLGFFYAPDPASQKACTLGGNLAQNASGARCLKYGGTLDHVLEITLVLPDGKTQTLARQETGPDWVGLLCGSEGTLGIVTQLKVKILPTPKHVRTFLSAFPTLEDCVQTVTDLTARGIIPRCMEAMDQLTTQTVEQMAPAGFPTNAGAALLLELDGEKRSLEKEEKIVQEVCRQNHALKIQAAQNNQAALWWHSRQNAYNAMARLAPNVLVCDGTVPRSELPGTLRKVRQILAQHNMTASLLFHAGDGNFHPQLIFDERNSIETQRAGKVAKLILQACIDAGGTVSGEHGIGVEKRSMLACQYNQDTLDLFSHIKHAFDPEDLANPCKIIPVDYAEKTAGTAKNEPGKLQNFQQQFKQQLASEKPFFITGTNAVLQTQETFLSVKELNEIVDIDLTNYTVTAQAGVTLKQLARTLKKHGVYSVLPEEKGTLGGAFSSGCYPAFYAHTTGLQALLPNGSCVRYGGKLTKNAAGYNLLRLFAGAQGAWGVVTELTFKIYAVKPAPLTANPFVPLRQNELYKRMKKELDPKNLLKIPEETAHVQ
ncbi:MAG: FAD-binding protein [Elusimicrobiaceae bacterium]|nr:FAD-binding protein [Elusimicrobiaceae bacterium]